MHQPNNHALTISSSIPPSCHPSVNHSPSHYILFPSSILSSNRQTPTHIFIHLSLSIISSISQLLTSHCTFIHSSILLLNKQSSTHYIFIHPSILSSIIQPLMHTHILNSFLHQLANSPIHSHLHPSFHPSNLSLISQSLATQYIFIHPSILSFFRQAITQPLHLHPFFHPLIHQPMTYYSFLSSFILTASHPSAN